MQTVVDGALAYLRSRPEVRGKRIGLMGFSMGASWSYAISTQEPEAVAAVVACYGTHSSPQGAYNAASAAYLGHYSDQDEWEPLEDVRQLESELRAAGREVTFHIYPGAKHWFFEPDRGDAYDPALAALAWERSVEFLHGHLD